MLLIAISIDFRLHTLNFRFQARLQYLGRSSSNDKPTLWALNFELWGHYLKTCRAQCLQSSKFKAQSMKSKVWKIKSRVLGLSILEVLTNVQSLSLKLKALSLKSYCLMLKSRIWTVFGKHLASAFLVAFAMCIDLVTRIL